LKNALIAAVVAAVVAAASGTAATILVTSKNIKNGTIQLVDLNGKTKQALKGKRGPRGFEGPVGDQGPSGVPGQPGQSLRLTQAYSDRATAQPGSFAFVNAVCPQGTEVVGGGHATENVGTAKLMPSNAYPIGMGDGRSAWYVVMHNDGPQPEEFWAVAYCMRAQ
jgi:hypothetical protein